jgi:hypothetical protein
MSIRKEEIAILKEHMDSICPYDALRATLDVCMHQGVFKTIAARLNPLKYCADEMHKYQECQVLKQKYFEARKPIMIKLALTRELEQEYAKAKQRGRVEESKLTEIQQARKDLSAMLEGKIELPENPLIATYNEQVTQIKEEIARKMKRRQELVQQHQDNIPKPIATSLPAMLTFPP